MPKPVWAMHFQCFAMHISAIADLNKTTLRSSFTDLFSAIADRYTALPVNANANPLDSFPSRLQALPCRRGSLPSISSPCPCGTSLFIACAKLCVSKAVHSLAYALLFNALPSLINTYLCHRSAPQCQSGRNYAAANHFRTIQFNSIAEQIPSLLCLCSSDLNRSILCRCVSVPN